MRNRWTQLITKGAIAAAMIGTCYGQTPPPLVPLPSGPIPTGLGVNEHNINEKPVVLQMIHDAGFRYLRSDLKWNVVETTAGVYDFSAYDTYVTNATAAGLKILFILDYKNPLYDGGYSPYTEAGDCAFANYAKASVAHFQGKGIIWEMYNEPTGFWTNPNYTQLKADSDADIVAPLYAAMANKAGKAIKDTYPNEIVVGPALPWSDSKSATYFNNSMSFLQQILQAGVGDYWDAVSDHPYRTVSPEWAFPDMATIRTSIATNSPNRALPLLDSEWGYTSTWWDQGTNALTYDQAEVQKARRLARAVMVDRMQGFPLTILYDWMNDGTNTANQEYNFGLVQQYSWTDPNPTITPLPAFNAIKTLTTIFSGYTYDSRVDTGDSTDYVVKFTNGSQNAWACWNRDGLSHQVTVPLGAYVPFTKTGYDGSAVVNGTSGANGVGCTTSESPQYYTVQ